jgi:hypothetical protein
MKMFFEEELVFGEYQNRVIPYNTGSGSAGGGVRQGQADRMPASLFALFLHIIGGSRSTKDDNVSCAVLRLPETVVVDDATAQSFRIPAAILRRLPIQVSLPYNTFCSTTVLNISIL